MFGVLEGFLASVFVHIVWRYTKNGERWNPITQKELDKRRSPTYYGPYPK